MRDMWTRHKVAIEGDGRRTVALHGDPTAL